MFENSTFSHSPVITLTNDNRQSVHPPVHPAGWLHQPFTTRYKKEYIEQFHCAFKLRHIMDSILWVFNDFNLQLTVGELFVYLLNHFDLTLNSSLYLWTISVAFLRSGWKLNSPHSCVMQLLIFLTINIVCKIWSKVENVWLFWAVG